MTRKKQLHFSWAISEYTGELLVVLITLSHDGEESTYLRPQPHTPISGGTVKWYNHSENILAGSLSDKHVSTSCHSTASDLSKRRKSTCDYKDLYWHPYLYLLRNGNNPKAHQQVNG